MFLLDRILTLHHRAHSLSLLYNFLTYISLKILHDSIFNKLVLLIHVDGKNWELFSLFLGLRTFLFFIQSELIICIEVLCPITFTIEILNFRNEIIVFPLLGSIFLLWQGKLAFVCGGQILDLIAWVLSEIVGLRVCIWYIVTFDELIFLFL